MDSEIKHPSSLPQPGCTPETLLSPRQNSVVTPSLVKKPRHPSSLCGFHPENTIQPNFLPIVCQGAPHQGLWPPRLPHTPEKLGCTLLVISRYFTLRQCKLKGSSILLSQLHTTKTYTNHINFFCLNTG